MYLYGNCMKKINKIIMGALLLTTPLYCFAAANNQSTKEESITYTASKTNSSSWSEYISSLVNAITNFIKQTVTTIQAYFMGAPTSPQQQKNSDPNTTAENPTPQKFTETISPPEKQQPQKMEEPAIAPTTQEQPTSKALVVIHPQELALQKAAAKARKSQPGQQPESPATTTTIQQETESIPLLILSIQNSLNELKKQERAEDITEINSPAIQKEIFGNIINRSKQLDILIKELPRNQQPEWSSQQLTLLTPANMVALKNALHQEIQQSHLPNLHNELEMSYCWK